MQQTNDYSINEEWIERAGGNTLGSRFFMWVLSRMGLNVAYLFLIPASIQYVLLDKRSKEAIREFRTHLGLKTTPADYFRHFHTFGMSLIDRYYFLMSNRKQFEYTAVNETIIGAEIAKGNGVILLGAHFGNWELAGNLLGDRLGAPVNFIMMDAERGEVKNTLKKATDRRNVSIIYVSPDAPDAMIAVANALRNGEIVCFHGDRCLDSRWSETVRFLGAPARFPTGPFVIAAITGAPLIPIFAVKKNRKEYEFRAFDPIRLGKTGRNERDQSIRTALVTYVKILEEMAEKYPYQWFNFYRFWKSQILRSENTFKTHHAGDD